MSENHERRDGADRKYPQIIRAVMETPWAILPKTLAAIVEVIELRIEGQRFSAEEIQARIGSGPAQKEFLMAGSVALIPVYGVITPKADLFSEMSGGTSVQRLQATLRAAVADKDVSAIVLDIDSPGGMTDLIPEVAAEIRAARGTKPIVAVANVDAASAAYWIAAQADEIVVSPSGAVGSIGVFAAHDDISGALEQAGVTTTLISAGKYKTEGNPYEPLGDEAKAEIQRFVDEFYGMFVADVAAGRGVTVEKVEKDFGQGRMLTAKNAVRAGMADRVDTFENVVAQLMRGETAAVPINEPDPPPLPDGDEGPEAAKSGLSFGEAVDSAHRAFDAVVTGAEALRALTGRKREQLSSLVERANELLATTANAEPESSLDEPGWDAELEHQLSRLR